MKNIETLLKEYEIELTEEQKANLLKGVSENYKTIAEYDKQKGKLEAAEDKVKTMTESLDKFKDVDIDSLNSTVQNLQDELKKRDDEYARSLSERDFNDLLKDRISAAKGRSAEKITKLLDLEALRESKNQEKDIDSMLKALAEDADTKGMFGDPEPAVVGTGSVIGAVQKPNSNDEDAVLRTAMGLPPVTAE